ncbi:MAG: hypothetical protein WBP93_00510 [Pyrinomonadaceae bacterium]
MSANASNTTSATPTANLQTQANEESGVPKKIVNAQTVCNEKNEKGKLCNGHLKQLHSGGEEAEKHLRGDDVLYKCQSCGTLYMGPPLGHVRDPDKQRRFVERELAALLQAAGGTLPAIVKNERGVFVLAEETAPAHAPAAKPATTTAAPQKAAAEKKAAPPPKPAASATQTAKPAPSVEASESKMPRGYVPPPAPGPVPGETHEQKLERLRAIVAEAKRRKAAAEAGEPIEASPASVSSTTTPAAASTSGTDSSAQADAHRPSAEAQAATGQASAAPLSSAAATASPAAQEEVEKANAAAPTAQATRKAADGLNRADFDTGPVAGETQEQKIARLRLVVNAAREKAGKPPKY